MSLQSEELKQKKNSTFEIILKSNPQNGYLWYLSNEPLTPLNTKVLVLVDEIKEPLPNYMGCKQHFNFSTGDVVGVQELYFTYKRSWETENYDEKRYKVYID